MNQADCSGGVLSLLPRKWVPPHIDSHSLSDDHIYDCLNGDACVVNGTNMECNWRLGYDNSSVLCSECLEGYYSSDRLTKTCEECKKTTIVFSITIGVLMIVLVSGFSIKKLIILSRNSQIHAKGSIKIAQTTVKGVLRVVIGHIQVLLLLSDLQLRGPYLFHSIFSKTAGSIIPSISPEIFKCISNIPFSVVVLITASLPLIIILYLIVLVSIVTNMLKSVKQMKRLVQSVFIFLFYLIHPFIMKQLLQSFHFHVQKIEGERYLQSNMHIVESSSEYRILFAVALVGTAVYGLICPIGMALYLLRSNKLTDKKFKHVLGFLYQGYRLEEKLYLWEVVIYFRKTSLLLLGVFLGTDRFVQSYLASIVLIGSFSLQNKFHPYRSREMNKLEQSSLLVLVATQMSLLLSSHYGIAEGVWPVLISAALLFFNLLFFVYAILYVIGSNLWARFCSSIKKGVQKQVHPTLKLEPNQLARSSIATQKTIQDDKWKALLEKTDSMLLKIKEISKSGENELEDIKQLLSMNCCVMEELERVCCLIQSDVDAKNVEKVDMTASKYDQTASNRDLQIDPCDECLSTNCVGKRIYNLWHNVCRFEQFLRESIFSVPYCAESSKVINKENPDTVIEDTTQKDPGFRFSSESWRNV